MTRWVVVGGGAAGCVVAARLAARPGHDVVLLEAGPQHDTPLAPAADLGPYLTDPTRLEPTEVVRRPGVDPESYLQGRGLGGSSLVNGSVVTGADPGGDRSAHLLPLEPPWAFGPLASALLATDAAARPVQLVRREGRRVTVADAYLASPSPSLTIRTDARVRSIRLRRRRAVGVELDDGTVDADRVVVCAGAIRTPALLLRSGVSVPGLGEHLQDHPAFTITMALADAAVDPSAPTISVAADHGPHQLLPVERLSTTGYGALVVGLNVVHSEGRVSLDDDGALRVELGQLTDERDRDALVEAVGSALDVVATSAFRAVTERAFVDAAGTPMSHLHARPDRIATWVVDHLGGHFHVAGSCRHGVVCDHGVVRGYDGLYVGDASALVGVPRADIYLEVVRQAERFVTGW